MLLNLAGFRFQSLSNNHASTAHQLIIYEGLEINVSPP